MSEYKYFNKTIQKDLVKQNRRRPLYNHERISPKIINVQPPQRPTRGNGGNINDSR